MGICLSVSIFDIYISKQVMRIEYPVPSHILLLRLVHSHTHYYLLKMTTPNKKIQTVGVGGVNIQNTSQNANSLCLCVKTTYIHNICHGFFLIFYDQLVIVCVCVCVCVCPFFLLNTSVILLLLHLSIFFPAFFFFFQSMHVCVHVCACVCMCVCPFFFS